MAGCIHPARDSKDQKSIPTTLSETERVTATFTLRHKIYIENLTLLNSIKLKAMPGICLCRRIIYIIQSQNDLY